MPYDSIDIRQRFVARPAIRWLGSLALVLASVLAGLLLLEVGLRVVQGPEALLHWPNLVLKSRLDQRATHGAGIGPSYSHDPTLGFVNTPGWASSGIGFDAQGFRRMPLLAANAAGIALAIPRLGLAR